MTKIVNIKNEKCDVYIGRGSKWGNKFVIGKDGNRGEVIEKYREWITVGEGRKLLSELRELGGKKLGCYCAPLECHGHVLKQLVEKEVL
jgi:hypothetical protein